MHSYERHESRRWETGIMNEQKPIISREVTSPAVYENEAGAYYYDEEGNPRLYDPSELPESPRETVVIDDDLEFEDVLKANEPLKGGDMESATSKIEAKHQRKYAKLGAGAVLFATITAATWHGLSKNAVEYVTNDKETITMMDFVTKPLGNSTEGDQ